MAEHTAELARIKILIGSMVLVEKQPVNASWIQSQYRKDFGNGGVPYQKFGSISMEQFLCEHMNNRLTWSLDGNGQKIFRAQSSDASQHLEALLKRQKTKPKKRGSTRRSFVRAYPMADNQSRLSKPGSRFETTRRSHRTRNTSPPSSQFFHRSLPSSGRPFVPQSRGYPAKMATSTFIPKRQEKEIPVQIQKPASVVRPSPKPKKRSNREKHEELLAQLREESKVVSLADPELSKQCADRIWVALRACGESAWHAALAKAYEHLFGATFDNLELEGHFGTLDMREIVWRHLHGRVIIECYIDSSAYYLTTCDAAKRKIEDAKLMAMSPCKSAPSPAKLTDQLSEMLIECFPHGIKLAEISKRHALRFQEGFIDPTKVYCQSWIRLLSGPLKTRFSVDPATDSVILKESYVKAHNITEKKKQEVECDDSTDTECHDESGTEMEEEGTVDKEEEEGDFDSSSTTLASLDHEKEEERDLYINHHFNGTNKKGLDYGNEAVESITTQMKNTAIRSFSGRAESHSPGSILFARSMNAALGIRYQPSTRTRTLAAGDQTGSQKSLTASVLPVDTISPERKVTVFGLAPRWCRGPSILGSPVSVINSSGRRIGWAFKTTNMKRLGVDPPAGVLDPKEAVLVAVSCDSFAYGQEDTNNDRITIEWTNTPDGAAKQFRREWFQGDGMVRRKNLPIEYNP